MSNSAEDGSLELENRELATRQVRRINDTLRKVRRIVKESQVGLPATTKSEPPQTSHEVHSLRIQEISAPLSKHDLRRERDDSTDKFLIPEPKVTSLVTDVFKRAFDLFEQECVQFNATRDPRSAVVRRWKLL